MRRLVQEECGATAVVVAVFLTMLVGLTALVVDIGDARWERRMLQNGADAAALAVAIDCAQRECSVGEAQQTAATYAEENNHRGAFVASVSGPSGGALSFTGGEVTVETRTGDRDGAGRLQQYFSAVLGRDQGLATSASATAEWRPVGRAETLPLTFSLCEWEALTAGAGVGGLPSDEVTITFANPTGGDPCLGPDSVELDFPGGFGWLESQNCRAEVTAGQQTQSTTGNTVNKTDCTAQDFRDLIGVPVLIPVYGSVDGGDGNSPVGGPARGGRGGGGSGTLYNVDGFVAFEMSAYKVSGGPSWSYPAGFRCDGPGAATNCIRGRAVRYVTGEGTPSDTARDFGALAVRLTD